MISITRAAIFDYIPTRWWLLTNRIPERVGNASQTIDDKSLNREEHNRHHQQHELFGFMQDAKRHYQRRCSCRWMRRFQQYHQTCSQPQ